MEAGRTEERRAVKKIKKLRSIDYERELEVLALLSYRKKVHPLSCDRLDILTDHVAVPKFLCELHWLV